MCLYPSGFGGVLARIMNQIQQTHVLLPPLVGSGTPQWAQRTYGLTRWPTRVAFRSWTRAEVSSRIRPTASGSRRWCPVVFRVTVWLISARKRDKSNIYVYTAPKQTERDGDELLIVRFRRVLPVRRCVRCARGETGRRDRDPSSTRTLAHCESVVSRSFAEPPALWFRCSGYGREIMHELTTIRAVERPGTVVNLWF